MTDPMEEALRDMQKRIRALERETVRVRRGEVAATGPLDVTIGGADVPFTDVAALDGAQLAGGDQVAVATFGGDLVVLGRLGGGEGLPAGAMTAFGGATAPDGWLLCDGSVVSRTTYARLFAAIGTAYNTGGESGSQFRLPDLRGRVPAGVDGAAGRMPDNDTLGAAGGSASHPLTPAQTPLRSHTHSGTTGNPNQNWVHDMDYNQRFIPANAGAGIMNTYETAGALDGNTGFQESAHTHNFTTGTPSLAEANGSPHENRQPYQVVNWIVRT